ncbi:predicted protein [Naegleria gruberi]|uniref:Mitochondrial inner membrane protease ATP23 n=1 Tax=Naegleria gruberi TaxID=5762 RepID=D2V0D0_NAEGR|nr:uncharacterized protein NAEGRDRAFT_62249 [Naegleria gruberi]EFC49503.1 predicted protein [Naegleria gruberi]|eukprot:XP_002682247.1 predicted protein [Naegleria gruberi strain NEG-M]
MSIYDDDDNNTSEGGIDFDSDWWDQEINSKPRRASGPVFTSDNVYHTIEKCRKDAVHLLQSDDRVKEIVAGIKSGRYGGTNILDEGLIVEMCHGTQRSDNSYSGLYEPVKRIKICCNRNVGIYELRRTLIHELVHAYDYARGFNRRHGCKFRACTEVRAYMLGGSCDLPIDLAKFNGDREACIKHHAFMSVNPYCDDATKVINEVYPQCHKDYSPIQKDSH